MKRIFLASMAMGGILMACNCGQAGGGDAQQTADSTEALTAATELGAQEQRMMTMDELEGKWTVLCAIDKTTAESDTTAHMTFNTKEMLFGAFAGCNSIGGNISQKGRSADYLAFENVACTQMACPDDEMERKLIECINATQSFHAEGDILCLCNGEGETIAKLKKAE